MATATFETVLGKIRKLPARDQKRLRDLLNRESLPSGVTNQPQEELRQTLWREGVIRTFRPSVRKRGTVCPVKPITIRGCPLSQTIVEERR